MAVPCIFQTKYRLGESNARLALFGDSPVLGEWTPRKACFADYLGEDDLYEVTVYLPVNTVCHFKWCIIDKNFNIIYCDNQKQRAFRVEDTMMYIKAPWNKELTVIPIRHRIGTEFLILSMESDRVEEQTTQTEQETTTKSKPPLKISNINVALEMILSKIQDLISFGEIGDKEETLMTRSQVEIDIADDMSATWEDGPNRVYSVEDNTVTVIECTWNLPQSYWICNHETESASTTKGTWFNPMQYYTPESPPVTFPSTNEVRRKVNRDDMKYYLIVGLTAAIGYGLYKMFDTS